MNPKFIQKFEDAGMKFVGRSTDGERMEIMELEGKYRDLIQFKFFFWKDERLKVHTLNMRFFLDNWYDEFCENNIKGSMHYARQYRCTYPMYGTFVMI